MLEQTQIYVIELCGTDIKSNVVFFSFHTEKTNLNLATDHIVFTF